MTSQIEPPCEQSAEDEVKRLRLRKVYIQLRVPRARDEIATIRIRKKAFGESGNQASKEATGELIYSNQRLIALREELESLEQERTAVLQGLRDFRRQETGEILSPGG